MAKNGHQRFGQERLSKGKATPQLSGIQIPSDRNRKDLRVSIGVPSLGYWQSYFGHSLALMTCYHSRFTKDEIAVCHVTGSILPVLRTEIAKNALNQNADYVLFLDSDMKFPKHLLTQMIKHDLPIVAVNYTTKEIPSVPLAEKMDSEGKWIRVHSHDGSSGIEEVAQVGMGAMLIKTDVFRIVPEPWFPMNWDGVELGSEGKGYIGEDIHFCRKVVEAGIPIFIDHDISKLTCHVGNFNYTTQLAYESWRLQATQPLKQQSETGSPEPTSPVITTTS